MFLITDVSTQLYSAVAVTSLITISVIVVITFFSVYVNKAILSHPQVMLAIYSLCGSFLILVYTVSRVYYSIQQKDQLGVTGASTLLFITYPGNFLATAFNLQFVNSFLETFSGVFFKQTKIHVALLGSCFDPTFVKFFWLKHHYIMGSVQLVLYLGNEIAAGVDVNNIAGQLFYIVMHVYTAILGIYAIIASIVFAVESRRKMRKAARYFVAFLSILSSGGLFQYNVCEAATVIAYLVNPKSQSADVTVQFISIIVFCATRLAEVGCIAGLWVRGFQQMDDEKQLHDEILQETRVEAILEKERRLNQAIMSGASVGKSTKPKAGGAKKEGGV